MEKELIKGVLESGLNGVEQLVKALDSYTNFCINLLLIEPSTEAIYNHTQNKKSNPVKDRSFYINDEYQAFINRLIEYCDNNNIKITNQSRNNFYEESKKTIIKALEKFLCDIDNRDILIAHKVKKMHPNDPNIKELQPEMHKDRNKLIRSSFSIFSVRNQNGLKAALQLITEGNKAYKTDHQLTKEFCQALYQEYGVAIPQGMDNIIKKLHQDGHVGVINSILSETDRIHIRNIKNT